MYRKVFVFWGEGLNVSEDGVKVFDTDFGRIAILTCFDANFDEVWQEAERKGAEIVFWPSAYGGGTVLNGYAMIHNYPIVAVGKGNMIDLLGKTIDEVERPRPQQFIATFDLDRTLIHTNFNEEKVARLLAEHKGEVDQERFLESESWYLLRRSSPACRSAICARVPNRDPARVPPSQPRADQRCPTNGQEDLTVVRQHAGVRRTPSASTRSHLRWCARGAARSDNHRGYLFFTVKL